MSALTDTRLCRMALKWVYVLIGADEKAEWLRPIHDTLDNESAEF